MPSFKKKLPSFLLCIQGAKIIKLTNIHLSLLDKYNVLFDFIPGSNDSGGFLMLWSSNLSPTKRIASSTGFQLLNLVKLDYLLSTVMQTQIEFKQNSLKLSIRFLPNISKIIMMDDFNALDDCHDG